MRRARSFSLLAGLAATVLAVAACSSPSSTSSSGTTTAGGGSTTAASSSGAGGASGSATTSGGGVGSTAVKVGLAYDIGGRGDQSFNDLAAKALDEAKANGIEIVGELTAGASEPDSAKVDRLNQLVDDGATEIVAVGFAYAGPLGEVAKANPDVHFAIVDDASLASEPNVASLTFAEEQGSYLVGVAAAKKSTTGKVGFIGGVNTPLIQKFQAGFEAGVKATNPSATVTSRYISEPPDFSGFNDPGKGETIATGMYNDGNDVIFAAAGGSGAGVFKAAKAAGKWGIGVDSDQYNISALADVKDSILTSMLKNVDVAVGDFIRSGTNGAPLTGVKVYDLKNDGVGYSTSGGFITDYVADIDAAKQKIISGEVTVPSTVG